MEAPDGGLGERQRAFCGDGREPFEPSRNVRRDDVEQPRHHAVKRPVGERGREDDSDADIAIRLYDRNGFKPLGPPKQEDIPGEEGKTAPLLRMVLDRFGLPLSVCLASLRLALRWPRVAQRRT